MELDLEVLARLQFALTIMFHYLFPPLTIGLGMLMVWAEGAWLKTKNPLYESIAFFWTRLFAVNFAMGVATGIVMEFEFGTNWATYSRFVGDVFGSALAAEGIFAFFLESGFLGVVLFGWNKVSAKFHYFATCMVCLGGFFSSIWIVIANSFMQTPAGYHLVEENGRISGSVDWTTVTHILPGDSNQVRWNYVQGAEGDGSEAAWLDQIELSALAGPDLVVDNVQYLPETYVLQLDPLNLTVVGKNQGETALLEDLPNDFKVEAYLSLDREFGNEDDVRVGELLKFQDLDPNDRFVYRATRSIPEVTTPGAYYLIVVVDSTDVIVEFDETKIGRLDHKVLKLQLLEQVPGVEFLTTHAHSGDEGITLDEPAPWGVLGVITPVTHSIPTLTANAVSMLAAGNSMVVNPHPGGCKSAAMAAEVYNRMIKAEFGIDPLICVINPPTLRTAEEIFRHEDIHLLVVTGGPGVARAAMKQAKRAIVAGPGNPPVVVDETADFDKAARAIIAGAAFDNNLLCIGEKEVFVVERVFDQMMSAMERAGAVRLCAREINNLTRAAIVQVGQGQDKHDVPSKEFLGQDTAVYPFPAGMPALNGGRIQ